jgi:flavorubredoxin
MRVLIVYESLFGNTHEVAEAIGAGVRGAHPDVDVACRPVAEAKPYHVDAADVLVVGGPTHLRGMTTGLSRKMGLQGEAKKAASEGSAFAPEPGAEGPGLRDWFDSLHEAPAGSRAVV